MTILKWFALWLVLAIAIGLAAGRQCAKYYRLSRRGVTVQGVVREKKPHQQIGYTFEANGHSYEGIARGDVGDPSFWQTSIGDEVLVHYLPDAPGISCLGSPRRLFSAELFPVLLAVLLFPTMIVGVLAFRYRRRAAPSMTGAILKGQPRHVTRHDLFP